MCTFLLYVSKCIEVKHYIFKHTQACNFNIELESTPLEKRIFSTFMLNVYCNVSLSDSRMNFACVGTMSTQDSDSENPCISAGNANYVNAIGFEVSQTLRKIPSQETNMSLP